MQVLLYVLAVYCLATTLALYRQQRQIRKRLIGLMIDNPRGFAIWRLAETAECSRPRAWAFLTRERLQRRIELSAVQEGTFINVYSYSLNRRGRTWYEPLAV